MSQSDNDDDQDDDDHQDDDDGNNEDVGYWKMRVVGSVLHS